MLRIDIPALRERPEDIPAIVALLTRQICRASNRPLKTFTNGAIALLAALPWSGNGTQLRQVIQELLADASPVATLETVLSRVRLDGTPRRPRHTGTLAEARQRFERDYIAEVLDQHRGRMSDAARTLGIQRPNLYRKARQLGISRTPSGRRA